jgi:hypothetical protein
MILLLYVHQMNEKFHFEIQIIEQNKLLHAYFIYIYIYIAKTQ